MLRILLLITGAVLAADTVLVASASNFNLGVYMPALIGLPPLLIGVFYNAAQRFFAHGWGAAVKWTLIVGYCVFAISFAIVAGSIYGHTTKSPPADADVVIVLGAGLRGDVPSKTLAARLDCAYDYLAQNPNTRVIVTGGMGSGETVTEASAMKKYLVNKGIAPGRVLLEDQSTSTQENLQNAKAIMDEEMGGASSIIVVSSDYHLYRASLVAKQMGMDVSTMGNKSIAWLVPNFYLREYVAVMGYRILGRLG